MNLKEKREESREIKTAIEAWLKERGLQAVPQFPMGASGMTEEAIQARARQLAMDGNGGTTLTAHYKRSNFNPGQRGRNNLPRRGPGRPPKFPQDAFIDTDL